MLAHLAAPIRERLELRPEVLALEPFDISARANADFGPDAIKLDANENPFAPLVEGAYLSAETGTVYRVDSAAPTAV